MHRLPPLCPLSPHVGPATTQNIDFTAREELPYLRKAHSWDKEAVEVMNEHQETRWMEDIFANTKNVPTGRWQ